MNSIIKADGVKADGGKTDLAKGVFAAVLTPLDSALAPNHNGLVAHCRWLLANGCDGLAVLGTTSEANSFSVEEREAILDALARSGIPGDKFLPGTGCCALPDTVRLTKRAVAMGAKGVLMLPPFYYKNVSEDGLFASFAQVIEAVGDARLRVYLYHFPQMSGIAIPNTVVERLLAAYPGIVAGMKDSSGDFSHMEEVARNYPGFAVMAGADHLLLPILKAGGAGCITAVANVASPLAQEVYRHWRDDKAEAAHQKLSAVRAQIAGATQISILKEIMARHSGDSAWRNVRPPLMPLAPAQADPILAKIADTGFVPAPL